METPQNTGAPMPAPAPEKHSHTMFWIVGILLVVALLAVVAATVYSFQGQSKTERDTSELSAQIEQLESQLAEKEAEIAEMMEEEESEESRIRASKAGEVIMVEDLEAGYEFNVPSVYGSVDIEASEKYEGVLVTAVPPSDFVSSSFLAYALDPGIEPVGRGAFWGDAAHYLDSDIISDFCNLTSEITHVQVGYDSCSVNVNPNGITYARLDYPVFQGVPDLGDVRGTESTAIIYVFNESTNFGIVISNERLSSEAKLDSSAMQSLIDSLEFGE